MVIVLERLSVVFDIPRVYRGRRELPLRRSLTAVLTGHWPLAFSDSLGVKNV
jgi:hypothetical protein